MDSMSSAVWDSWASIATGIGESIPELANESALNAGAILSRSHDEQAAKPERFQGTSIMISTNRHKKQSIRGVSPQLQMSGWRPCKTQLQQTN